MQLLAEDGLVVAIDDLQWLDASSASALGFALRRLPDTSMLLLWTRRLDAGEPTSVVETALDSDRIDRIRVGPLSVGATHQLLRARLSRTVSRPTLLRLHEASGGNPFYALELARAALGADGSLADPTQPLPVPERLEELVSTRLDGFTGATRDALVLASAHGRLTVTELGRAGIEQALSRRRSPNRSSRWSVEACGSHTRCWLRSSTRGCLQPSGSVRTPRSPISSTIRSPTLVTSRSRPSERTPSSHASSSRRHELPQPRAHRSPRPSSASTRSGLHPPATALRSPGASQLPRVRTLATGGIERARTLSEELLALAAPGPERAEALALAAEVEGDYIGRAIELQREALAEPGAPAALCATLHQKLALSVRFREGMEPAEEHARAAVELAEEVGDDGLRAAALAGLALVRLNGGKAGSLRLAEQAAELAALSGEEPRAETDFTVAHVLLWSGELERARQLLEDLYAHWSRAGRAERRLRALVPLASRSSVWDGSSSRTRTRPSPASSPPRTRAPGRNRRRAMFPSALIAAHRGDLARARRLAEEMVRLAELHDTKLCGALRDARDRGALERGRPRRPWSGSRRRSGSRDPADGAEPTMSWWRAEQAEALLELGLVDDAEARIAVWEEAARRLDRAWPLAEAVRCRGLVAAARGDVDEAIALLEQAVEVSSGFGRGRALLALGVARRRARQKRPAREAIEAACATFEELGAAGWAARARDELGRIGGRTRVEGLTPAERRVADLVAAGRTNAEVAASLFLAERTVASHLTRVYSKLGVRSRTELSRKLR